MAFTSILKMIMAGIMALFTMFGSVFTGVTDSGICMIGHRGYSSKYPDNTEIAFIKAAENGSGGCETDIRMTKDGVIVLSHDSEAVFKDGSTLKISESTYEELIAKPLKNKKTRDDVYICTFRRYLEIMAQYNMVCFVELKGEFNDEQVKEIFNLADEVYCLEQCILQSFNFDNLLRAKALFPDLPVMLTYGTNDTGYERCFEYGISIDVNYTTVTQEMVDAFHERGLQVAIYTANDYFSLAYAKSFGPDYIESDVYGAKGATNGLPRC